MAESSEWSFPEQLRPQPEELSFNLQSALDSVVLLRADIPGDAFTAPILGTERAGYGVVIGDDGLVLTIGYLITEADSLWLTANDGTIVRGHAVAYDFATGFGLAQPLGRLGTPWLARGKAAALSVGDPVTIVGHGGRAHALKAQLIAKREFAGYWEYLLDEALFTAPPHPQWGGAAMLDSAGRLVGIGSLFVEQAIGGERVQANMFVPTDLLEPILDDLLRFGRNPRPARPWLGLYAAETDENLIVGGLAKGGPAENAGVLPGDVLLEVAGERASSLAELFRKTWRLGSAGVEVPLTLARNADVVRLKVRSADRGDYLRKPALQ
ncbi:MAG: serine protease [Betaproteobacteria bacterium]|nr:MAG: serine protease [Betaproteobacteria bacterium]